MPATVLIYLESNQFQLMPPTPLASGNAQLQYLGLSNHCGIQPRIRCRSTNGQTIIDTLSEPFDHLLD